MGLYQLAVSVCQAELDRRAEQAHPGESGKAHSGSADAIDT
jgi:hypothetical protein